MHPHTPPDPSAQIVIDHPVGAGERWSMASWQPEDCAGGYLRQQSIVHTTVEAYPPALPASPAYAAGSRWLASSTTPGQAKRVLVDDASPAVRVVVANLVLVLVGTSVVVLLVAVLLIGIRLWGWLT